MFKINYYLVLSLCIFSTIKADKFNNNYKIVAYYPNWYGDYSSIVQWDKITHVNYAFGLPDSKGKGRIASLKEDSSIIKPMIKAAKSHDVIPILSVGGWSCPNNVRCSEVFEKNTDTDEKCKSLAENIVDQAVEYGFKGVDIDWEYPKSRNSTQGKQYAKFMKYLSNYCNENFLLLTVAVSAYRGNGFTDEIIDSLDFINIMAYDGNQGAGHSPYSYAVQAFNFWKDDMGISPKKLTIGVPFFDRPQNNAYSEIVEANSKNAQKDSTIFDGQTIYYNGIPTIRKKAEFAAKNAGGIMIWEIHQDSKDEDLSLLNVIYQTTKSIVGEK